MKEDALAPVIAVMLILAAIVTFLSIWNAIYVPSMKESAEIEHLHNVEESLEKFSSDIDYAASSHQNNLVFSEPVQLGGGDFMFNLLKSSGTLNVQNKDSPVYNLTFYNTMPYSSPLVIGELNGTLVNFSYEPVSNFWQDQGYSWQYGYLNVTKYGTLCTPLSYDTMDNVINATEGSGSLATFAKSFATVDYTVNQTGILNTLSGLSSPNRNCTSLVLWAVNVTASPDHSFISSNGNGMFKLTSDINFTTIPLDSQQSVTNITFMSDQEQFGNATVEGLNETFFNKVIPTCNNIVTDSDTNDALHQYQYDIINQQESPVNVTLNVVEIRVEAY